MLEIRFAELSDRTITEMAESALNDAIPDWQKSIWSFLRHWFSLSEGITVFTSGSTGTPKEIFHRKEFMLYSAALTCNALQLDTKHTALLCLPATKIAGMMMLVRSIYTRMNLICVPPTTAPLGELPENVKIDFAAFTPMQLTEVSIKQDLFQKASGIRKIILGGESIGERLLSTIEKMDNEVYSSFGMTETISHVALKRLNGAKPDKHYKVLGDIVIERNTNGCLIIRAAQLGQPELVTSDEVEIFSETEFDWLGRTDNVINTGGVKIHAEVVEALLKTKTGKPFFVCAQKNERTGQEVAMALLQEDFTEGDLAVWQQHFLFLEKLMRPKTILLLARFTFTDNGKINRLKSLEHITASLPCS